MPAFFTCVSKKFFALQNCFAPENELFFRKNVPEKGSNASVLQAFRVHYGGKRAVSQAFYPYRGSACNEIPKQSFVWGVDMRLFKTKQKTELPVAPAHPFVTAVIVAAGNSTRMGGVNKQFLRIDGVPVLIRTLCTFSESPWIDEIIVAAREADIPEMFSLVKSYDLPKVTDIVKGGETRQESVFAAIRRCSPFSEFFAIHDGARPLVTEEVIAETVQKAFAKNAAATGVRVKDTIKVVKADGEITETPDRSTLWAVHTPQVFARRLYLNAADTVPGSAAFTDDCKLMEAAGIPVFMVEGSYENIKITTPEDIALAEGILAGRQK